MKLSNKILIAFFGTILAFTLLAFTEIRLKGESRILTDENSIAESVEFDSIKYLVISRGLNRWVEVSASENPRLEMKSKSGNILSKLKYELKNDTLYLNEMDEEESHFDVAVFVPRNGFTGLDASSAYVQITNLRQQMLSISQLDGRIDFGDNVDIAKVSLESKDNARIEIHNSRVDTLSIRADNSRLTLYGKIRLLEGTLENNTSLYASDVAEMNLKKDKESSIRVTN